MLLFSTKDSELEASYFSSLGIRSYAECLLGCGAECSVPQQKGAARVHMEWRHPIRLNQARAPSPNCEFAQSAQSSSPRGLETCFSTAGTLSDAEWILSCSPIAFSSGPLCSHHERHPQCPHVSRDLYGGSSVYLNALKHLTIPPEASNSARIQFSQRIVFVFANKPLRHSN